MQLCRLILSASFISYIVDYQLFNPVLITSDTLELIQKNILYFFPEVLLTLSILILIIIESIGFYLKNNNKKLFIQIAGIVFLLITLVAILQQWQLLPTNQSVIHLFERSIIIDKLSIYAKIILWVGLVLTWLYSINYANKENKSEYYIFLITMLLGTYLMVSAQGLLMMYLSLEFLSLTSYILTAYQSKNQHSAEAAMKYFIYGALSSASMLYGMSLLYGITGSLDLQQITIFLSQHHPNHFAILICIVLMLSGFLYKISAFPFHFWTPDIYQGALTPITALFSVVSKIAGFIFLIRFASYAHQFTPHWTEILTVIALLTLTIGNLSALYQTNFKRLLAYSSIAQAGFILIGLIANTQFGTTAIIFYLTIYLFMNLLAFYSLDSFAQLTHSENINDWKGLTKSQPLLSTLAIISLISLIGLPPTAGFIAKLNIFLALWETYQLTHNNLYLIIFIISIINTLISLFYYLKIPVNILSIQKEPQLSPHSIPLRIKIIFIILSIPILWLGLFHFDTLFNFIQAK